MFISRIMIRTGRESTNTDEDNPVDERPSSFHSLRVCRACAKEIRKRRVSS